jgi:hypothetical protein
MYSILRSLSTRELVLSELPTFFASFVIAELFYKFHSFTLECLAFLATWSVLGAAASWVRGRLGSGSGERA